MKIAHWSPIHKRLLGAISSCLILLCISLIFYPYTPEVSYMYRQKTRERIPPSAEVQAATEQYVNSSEDTLLIPKIDVKAPLIEGDEIGILDKKEGVWHQTGDIDEGNFVIAGHRFKYLPPNTSTLYHLDKLDNGDEITIFRNKARYSYKIEKIFTVNNDDMNILEPTDDHRLIIYTCVDQSFRKRLVVQASFIEKIAL